MRSSEALVRSGWPTRVLLAGVVALTAGCSGQKGTAGVRFDVVAEAAPPLVWPAAPAPPRIRHLANVATPGDVGARGTWFSRLVRAITGGREVRVQRPHGIAVDSAGRVFVVDVALRGVHIFDPVNGEYRFLTTTGKGAFRSPVGIALADNGTVYVSDSELGEVVVFDAAGKERRRMHEGLERPTGMAYDQRRGVLYVADAKAHRIAVFDSTGRARAAIGRRGIEDGEFNFPTNVVVTADGGVLVTDAMNFRVQVFSPEGKFLRKFGHNGDAVGNLARPKGVALDSEGHVYVVDGLFDVVNVYDAAGQLLLSFGGAGHGRGEFWLASGIAIDRQDRVYVSDSYNGRIQVLQYLAEGR
jgi:DNA-binding beta-propeller fold protein YncE